jgi:hypothetical protein
MNQSIDNQSFGLPIPLPLELKKCGFLLKQEYRLAAAVAYSVTDIVTGDFQGFEVFELRIQQAKTLPNGVRYPHKEIYPSAEAFGKWAFAPSTMRRALEIFIEIELKEVAKSIKLMDTPQQIAKNLVRTEFEPSF